MSLPTRKEGITDVVKPSNPNDAGYDLREAARLRFRSCNDPGHVEWRDGCFGQEVPPDLQSGAYEGVFEALGHLYRAADERDWDAVGDAIYRLETISWKVDAA